MAQERPVKEKYLDPEMEIIFFDTSRDIITESLEGNGHNKDPGWSEIYF